jgi:hypothetical protein
LVACYAKSIRRLQRIFEAGKFFRDIGGGALDNTLYNATAFGEFSPKVLAMLLPTSQISQPRFEVVYSSTNREFPDAELIGCECCFPSVIPYGIQG